MFKYFKSLLFIGLGLFLLFIAFKGIDFKEFLVVLKNISLKWVLLSMLFGYLAFVFRGLRWYLLIKPLGYRPNIFNLINAIAFGYLFNSFIPRSGEVVRCTSLNKVSNIPVSKLFGHVILERLIDFILLFTCILFAFLLNYQDFLDFATIFTLPNNIVLYLTILGMLVFLIYRFKTYFIKPRHVQQISSFIKGIKEGFLSIQKMPNKLLFWIYTLLIWFCYLMMTVVCFYCFSETLNLNLGQGLFIMVAGGLGMVVPTPTGIGSYHYLVIQALMAISITRETSQFFAIIVHSSQAIMIIVAGFFAMIFLYRQKQSDSA
tara:strand:+ start:1337 stop:2290 length:954 start_codon:yes stop_codon:yes gene_type:complete